MMTLHCVLAAMNPNCSGTYRRRRLPDTCADMTADCFMRTDPGTINDGKTVPVGKTTST